MGSDVSIFTSLYFNIETGNGIIILINRSLDKETGAVMKQMFERIETVFSILQANCQNLSQINRDCRSKPIQTAFFNTCRTSTRR